ncbi:TPA: hypothetical protein N6V88_004432 [Escherichia coli]|nr:hypothetical protein [Escherichia coli]
MNAAGASRVHV